MAVGSSSTISTCVSLACQRARSLQTLGCRLLGRDHARHRYNRPRVNGSDFAHFPARASYDVAHASYLLVWSADATWAVLWSGGGMHRCEPACNLRSGYGRVTPVW